MSSTIRCKVSPSSPRLDGLPSGNLLQFAIENGTFMVTFTINIPPMLAYIPARWILWAINPHSKIPLPSGYVKIAIENGHRNSWVFPLNMVIFQFATLVYQRVVYQTWIWDHPIGLAIFGNPATQQGNPALWWPLVWKMCNKWRDG